MRYTDETKTFSLNDNRAICNTGGVLPATCLSNANLFAPSGVKIPRAQSIKIWTPRFAVNFKPADDVLLFVSATRGFKSGGWNARGSATNTFLPFGPEKVWSYEAGIKSELFARRLRANLTVYQEDVTDLQTPSGAAQSRDRCDHLPDPQLRRLSQPRRGTGAYLGAGATACTSTPTAAIRTTSIS